MRRRILRVIPAFVGSLLLAGCGSADAPAAPVASEAAASPKVARADGGRERSGELLNPENSAMVFLYYEWAGLTPPFDQWVESDSRLQFARPADKAALRTALRAELESAALAVRDVGFLRLTLEANLSEYDPAYGEFTVRALAPSSVVSFEHFGEQVSLRFGNGRTAQIWRVPEAEARAVNDKLQRGYGTKLDVLLRIRSVQPAPGGGTLVTDVVEYELREGRSHNTLARVQVAPQ